MIENCVAFYERVKSKMVIAIKRGARYITSSSHHHHYLSILDPGHLGPGMRASGVGRPSPALIAFMFCFVLFVRRLLWGYTLLPCWTHPQHNLVHKASPL